jgi:hypothetical protein
MMIRKYPAIFATILAIVLAPTQVFAQSALLQGGPWAPGHAPMYIGQGSTQPVLQDSGPAAGGGVGIGLSELLLAARGTGAPPYASQGTGPYGSNFCDYDAPTTSPTGYHFLCLSANAGGGGLLTYGYGGGASPLTLNFVVNGTAYPFPFSGGGGGSPGGSNGQIQYNNSGSFGGFTAGGDLTFSAPNFTLNTVNSNPGTYGSSTLCPTFTVNVKGLITAASQTACAGGGGGSGTVTTGGYQALATYTTNPTGTVVGPTADALMNGGVLSLGSSGVIGAVVMGNATSGTITLAPVSGALGGAKIAGLPANSGIIAELNLAQTWSAVQTFSPNDLVLSGVTGSTQCLQADSSGVVTGAGLVCGPFSIQNAGTVLAGPISGAPNLTTFRALTGTDLPLFSSSNNGAVTASGGGTTNFLRADGTWAAPPGGSGTITLPQTVAGTVNSGGIVWTDGTSHLVSSVVGTAGTPVLWGGTGTAPLTTATLAATSPTTKFPTVGATWVINQCLTTDSNGNVITAGGSCTTGGGGGTVNSGTLNALAYYSAAGTAVSATANATIASGALTLGASGTVGSLTLGNATSGTLTISPVTGALGTVTASLPANTGIIAELNLAQSWTALQTFGSGASIATLTLSGITGGGTQCLQVSNTGVVSGTTAACGSGGSGSGTVNSGASGDLAYYASTGTAVSQTTTGAGVLTALGINVGTAGSFVVNGGALGTPSGGVATNFTGIPLTTASLASGATGILPQANGGSTQFVGAQLASVSNPATAYTLVTPTPNNFSLSGNPTVCGVAQYTNGPNATLNVGFTSTIAIKSRSTGGLTSLVGGEIEGGLTTCFAYDGTYWELLSKVPGTVEEKTGSYTATAIDGNGDFYTFTSSGTLTIPQSSTLPNSWNITLFAQGGPITVSPYASDTINGGLAGASVTIPTGQMSVVTTNGSGAVFVPISGVVAAGTANRLAYYAANGTTVSQIGAGSIAQFLVENASAVPTFVSASGDCLLSATGTFTCTKTSGTSFGSLATVTPGTGVAVALAANTNSTGGVGLINGSITSGDCLKWTAVSGITDAGAGCGITGLTVGTTTIAGGVSGYVEFNNGGVLGEKPTTGTGNVVLSASPTFSGTIGGSGVVPFAALPTITANTVLGQTTAGVPSPLAMPTSGTSGCAGTNQAVNWTSGGGFGCVTISAGGSGGLTNVYDITNPTYGCVASTSIGSANQATCIQAAINAAAAAGGGVVWVPDGFWNLTSQVWVKRYVTLQCASNGYTSSAQSVSYSSVSGSIFSINWGSGTQSSATAAVWADSTSAIKNCGFWHPNQSATASTPTVYGSTILIYTGTIGDNVGTEISGNWFANSYVPIDLRGSVTGHGIGAYNVFNNAGTGIAYNVMINWVQDWATIHDNHWNSGLLYIGDPSPANHLRGWIASNGVGYLIQHSDWVTIYSDQLWGYETGVNIDMSTACCGAYVDAGPVTLSHVQFDATFNGVAMASGTVLGINVNNSTFTAFNPYLTGLSSEGEMFVSVGGSTTSWLNLNNNYVFGPSFILVNGNGAITNSNISGNNITTSATGIGNCIYISSGTQAMITQNTCLGGFSTLISASGVTTVYAPTGSNAL